MDVRARGAGRTSAPSCPTSEAQATSDHGWRFPQDAERLAPLIAEARRSGVRVSLFMDPHPEADARRRARSAPTASSSTPRAMPARTARRSERAVLARFAATRRSGAARGPGRQRRPRPEPRQPRRFPARRARRAGGVDRPRAGRRRAGARPVRDGARLPPLHSCARLRQATAASASGRRDDLRHRHRHLRHPPHRRYAARAAASASPRRCSARSEIDVFRCRRRAGRGARHRATWQRAFPPRRPSPRRSAWACACR